MSLSGNLDYMKKTVLKMNDKKKQLCIVTGVGPEKGTGAEIAKYFSEKNYIVAMIARNSENLFNLEKKYNNSYAYPCDISNIEKLLETLKTIKHNHGDTHILIHNAPSASRGSILDLDPINLEKNFRVNTTALLYLVRETLPGMLKKRNGHILVTGNTASTRGKAHWGFFASTKASQRILAESIAREFGPKGIHVAYFIIDAAIDTPRTRPILQPDKNDDFFAKPRAIAEEMYKTVLQDKSTWSFRVELRPFGEIW